MSSRAQRPHSALPPEVVAAITAAIAIFMDRPVDALRFRFKGPFPISRPDAGAYRLASRLTLMARRDRGGRA